MKNKRYFPPKEEQSKEEQCNRVFADETPYCPNCGAKMDGDSKC